MTDSINITKVGTTDVCKYRYLVLNNKLQVLLVSDEDTDRSAVTLSVDVGNFSDPWETQGLAHFLEHMLFMGTEKYPKEDYYNDFLSKHGGSSNAFTDDEVTTYFFDIAAPHLEQGIDIFAQFFIAPLFNSSGVKREMNAVNSEHQKNLKNDLWRKFAVLNELANKKHPYHKFGTGSLDTLGHKDIVDRLKKFYQSYYSANRMRLCIYGNNGLDELEGFAKEYFSDVENRNIKLSKELEYPFDFDTAKKDQLAKCIKIVPVKKSNVIEFIWYVPNKYQDKNYKPIETLCHILGHESEGSICYYLKEHRLAHSIVAGDMETFGDVTQLVITIKLTKKGFKNINQVVDAVFDYLKMLSKTSENERKEVYDEYKMMEELSLNYKPKNNPSSYVIDLVDRMKYYAPEDVVSGPYLLKPWTKKTNESLNDYLKLLTKNRCIVMFSSSAFEKEAKKSEQWYGVNYCVSENVTLEEFSGKKSTIEITDLSLPPKNKFLPSKFDIIKDKVTECPEMVKVGDNDLELWFKGDKKFNRPFVLGEVLIKTPYIVSTKRASLLVELWIKTLQDSLNSILYQGMVARTVCSFGYSENGLIVSFEGYRDNLKPFLKTIVSKALEFKPSKDRFEYVKEEFQRKLNNYKYESPRTHIAEILTTELNPKRTSILSKKSMITDVTHDELDDIINKIKEESNVRCLIQGNCTKEEAKELASLFEVFQVDPYCPPLSRYKYVKNLQNGTVKKFLDQVYNNEETNSASLVYYQLGYFKPGVTEDDVKHSCMVSLIDSIISSKYFDQIRTNEQLGYITYSASKYIGNPECPMAGYCFLNQSDVKNPEYVIGRIETFLKNCNKNYIQELTDEDFDKYRSSAIHELEEKHMNLREEFMENLFAIQGSHYIFDYKKKLIEYLKTVTKKDFCQYFNLVMINKRTRKVFKIGLYSKKIKEEEKN